MTRQDRQEKLFRAIGYVGDDLIQRADAPAQAERKQPGCVDQMGGACRLLRAGDRAWRGFQFFRQKAARLRRRQ